MGNVHTPFGRLHKHRRHGIVNLSSCSSFLLSSSRSFRTSSDFFSFLEALFSLARSFFNSCSTARRYTPPRTHFFNSAWIILVTRVLTSLSFRMLGYNDLSLLPLARMDRPLLLPPFRFVFLSPFAPWNFVFDSRCPPLYLSFWRTRPWFIMISLYWKRTRTAWERLGGMLNERYRELRGIVAWNTFLMDIDGPSGFLYRFG